MKTKNKEQEEYNKERIVDINLVLQYMESLDITKEYFTELGEGHIRGLASCKDELKFVSKDEYDKEIDSLDSSIEYCKNQNDLLNKENKELKINYNELLKDYNKLKNKKRWFK